MTRDQNPKIPRHPGMDPAKREVVDAPNRRTRQPSMDWDVVRFRSDADEPWRVTAIRVLPRVHPMMPQGLKIRVEWFRRWADVDETAVDPALFDELEHWIENRGFGDGEMG